LCGLPDFVFVGDDVFGGGAIHLHGAAGEELAVLAEQDDLRLGLYIFFFIFFFYLWVANAQNYKKIY
jgi:hypothetical protein